MKWDYDTFRGIVLLRLAFCLLKKGRIDKAEVKFNECLHRYAAKEIYIKEEELDSCMDRNTQRETLKNFEILDRSSMSCDEERQIDNGTILVWLILCMILDE